MLQVRCESYEFVLVCTLVVTVIFCQNQVVVKVVLFWSIQVSNYFDSQSLEEKMD